MNRKLFAVISLLLIGLLGFVIGRQSIPPGEHEGPSADTGSREVLYWVAPMDPNYRREEPGKSPMGMDLVPVYADQIDSQAGVVKIGPAVVDHLGVRTEPAIRGPLSRRIETVGYISYDEDTVQHVHTRVEGWVEKLTTKAAGERVSKGQLLFEFYAPILVSAQDEYLVAVRSGNATLKKASRDRLVALGMREEDVARLEASGKATQRVPVYAENDGVIAHLGVREGIFVTPSTEVMSVAKLDSVWVLADVFERQSTWVEPGQEAVVTLDYLPGETLRSTVDYVYPELDPVTRTLKVRLRFDNVAELLRPNMFAHVVIYGKSTGEVVHVPRQSVIRGGSINRVVVDLGDGRYQSKPVTLGIESGTRIAIRRGLKAGEQVVTSAQFLIDSESNIKSALDRLDSADAGNAE